MACSGCGKSHAAQRSGKWQMESRLFSGEVHVNPQGTIKVAPPECSAYIGKPFTHLLMWIQSHQGNGLIARRIP